jgi:hypothetical protein
MNNLAPAFYSDCDDLIMAAADAGAVGWVVGHHHWTHQIEVGGVRLLSRSPDIQVSRPTGRALGSSTSECDFGME